MAEKKDNKIEGFISAYARWKKGKINVQYQVNGDITTLAKIVRAVIEAICQDTGKTYDEFIKIVDTIYTYEGD